MNLIKKPAWILALILALGPLPGCALLSRHKKNEQGYYEVHYSACGPVALEKAINEFHRKQGMLFAKNPAPRKEISQKIQKRGSCSREILSYFDKQAVQITWPSEIKKIANEYGFDVVTVNKLENLDPEKDIALVLIHGKFFSKQYHWAVYPLDEVENFYGKVTVVDIIYLIKRKGK